MSKSNNSVNRFFKVLLFATAIIFSPFVHAMPVHDGDKPKAAQMEVEMAGTTDTELLVEVKVFNGDAKRLLLIIENERGDELYRKEIDKAGFHSMIRFPKDNNITEYNIKLRTGTKSLEQYKIKSTSRIIEDVTISKL